MATRARLFGTAIASLATIAWPAGAQELPPLPATLLNISGAVCISVSKEGSVGGAYILTSTGSAQADADMLAWVRQLHWPVAKPNEKMRDTWFPMPIAFGDKKAAEAPRNCAKPA